MDKRLNLILQQLDTLPTLPAVALKVLEVTGGNSNASVGDVVKLVSSDPSLTTRILEIVNRADMGMAGEKPMSIDRAVSLLGFESVRYAVLAVSIFQTFQATPCTNDGKFCREDFWKHCIAVGCCAELLAMELRKSNPALKIDPSEAFVCGLLHDIGKIALDATLPKSFARVVEAAELLRGNIADLERQIVGLDHMVVGKRLAEKWQLPATIRDVIWLHGQSPDALPANVASVGLINLITFADAIVRDQHIGYSGNFTQCATHEALMAALGLTKKQVDAVAVQLVSQIEPRAQTMGLGQASTSQLYQHALEQANKELCQVTDQLSHKNLRLAIRSKFFEALSEFHSELRPDAPTETVLAAIGQTAVAILETNSAAIFSLAPKGDFAETILVDQAGDVFQRTMVDFLSDSSPRTRGDAGRGAAFESADAVGATKTPLSQPLSEYTERSEEKTPSQPPPEYGERSQNGLIRRPGDGPISTAGEELEWMLRAVSPRLGNSNRFWICLESDGRCIGGIIWGAPAGESQRLGSQTQEISALAGGWSLALRTAQIRDEARALAEQLAEANRQLQQAQAELLRKKTIVTVGEMAAGAAHEMNNPLAVISGRSQLLASQLSDPKHKAMAHLVYEQSHRLSQIISELMDFARPEAPQPVATDLADLVSRILHEAKQETDRADSVRVKTTVTDMPAVLVDPKQVGAAVAEIVHNAIDAIGDGKAVDGKAVGEIEIHAAFNAHASNVVLTISDNGCGMDEATLRRAFDPFFSHKPAGRQRGMGLAKAQRWIESSGGSVRLESHVGRGTRAVIQLPVVLEKVKSNEADISEAKEPRRRKA